MSSMRDIKRRIKSVNSTKQITNAMYLVASSKLNKAKNRLNSTRPFFNEIKNVISDILSTSSINHPYLINKKANNTAVIVITGDRGLCGGYNANVNKLANTVIKSSNDSVIAVGNKSNDFFKNRANIIQSFTNISEYPTYEDALKIGELAKSLFKDGKVDEIYLAYTEFVSTLVSKPTLVKLFPLDAKDFETEKSKSSVIYEPDAETVLNYIIPKYVNTLIYGALVESAVCELGARMTSMDSATENAEKMMNSLSLIYNRARQTAITQEITEIVSGSGIFN